MLNNTAKLAQFRQQVYQILGRRADSKMELLDALCSHDGARSVAELSLTPAFRRHYSALYKALADLELQDTHLQELAARQLPAPRRFPFWLLGVDVTPAPRPFAVTLSGRQVVYQPTAIPGQRPLTLGHQYSSVALLLPEEAGHPSWVAPLSVQRVDWPQDKEMVGNQQVQAILANRQLPLAGQLCVEVVDSAYSKAEYLHAGRQNANLVTITRVRGNRVFYEQPPVESRRRYGEAFELNAAETWRPADEERETHFVSRRDRRYRVTLQAWHNLLMRGQRKPSYLPMHRHPFTLLRVVVWDACGRPLFQRPLWLIVMGDRRHEVSTQDAYAAYLCRSQLEHFFRFGKQRLMLSQYQTPVTPREEQWWRLVHLAYLQLWVARTAAQNLPRPWERYLPSARSDTISARRVQRDFNRLIRQLGTPATVPKPRNRGSGRRRGQGQRRRPRHGWIVRA